jgi:hypothetical protein
MPAVARSAPSSSTVLQEVSDKKLYAFAKIDDKVYRVVSYNTSPGE